MQSNITHIQSSDQERNRRRNSKLLILLLSCLLMIVFLPAMAGTETALKTLTGAAINNMATLNTQDQWYNQGSSAFTVESSNAEVTLRFNDENRDVYTSAWEITVDYTVTLYDIAGNQLPNSPLGGQSLTIDYNPTGSYTDIATVIYKNAHRAEVSITNTALTNIAAIPNDVYLDNQITTVRYYNLDLNDPTHITNATHLLNTNELEISWAYVQGAESYDLEVVFVDHPITSGQNPGLPYDFRDGIRINTPEQHYRISLAYPHGTIVYRVRPVGRIANDAVTRLEGAWTLPRTGSIDAVPPSQPGSNITAAPQHFYVNGTATDRTKNWQYSAVYAEDGKRKEAISYFDGALRNRESITVVNSDCTAVVGQTIYDWQGRPAVQMLPAPRENNGIQYYNDAYAIDLNGQIYSYDNFDWDAVAQNPEQVSTTGTGAGYYYSDQNTGVGPTGEYVPDAEGYPYARTTYKNDGSGRVESQSNVGPTFKTGAGRETQMLYGNPTGQQELDRLFGNEVGYVGQYKKVISIDPNGQASVAYIDQKGRTIATALAGEAPDNLVEIDTKTPAVPLTADLTGFSTLVGNVHTTVNTFLVTENLATYTFNYTLAQDVYCDDCLPSCVDCRYDLNIRLIDEDGNPVTSIVVNSGNMVDQNISLTSAPVNFTATLNPGTYTIEKTLTLNDAQLQTYADDFPTNQTCITPPVITAECDDCYSACYDHYTFVNADGDTLFYDDSGAVIAQWSASSMTYSGNLTGAQNLIALCQEVCPTLDGANLDACQDRLSLIETAMSPHGQYFDNLPQQDQAGYLTTNFPVYSSGLINDWLNTNVMDEAVGNAQFNQTFASIAINNWDDVRTFWDDAWLYNTPVPLPNGDAGLIYSHPEYVLYQKFCEPICPAPFDPITLSDYHEFMYNVDPTTVDFYAVGGGINITEERFNPLNVGQNSNQSPDPSLYQPFDQAQPTETTDVIDGCNNDFVANLTTKLQQFVTVTGGSSYSIWYVLDDPNGGATDPLHPIHPLLASLHDPTTGIIATNQVTHYEYFRSVYNFLRDQEIHNQILNDPLCNYLTIDASGLTIDGFAPVFFDPSAIFDAYDGSVAGLQTLNNNILNDIAGVPTTEEYNQAQCACDNITDFLVANNLETATAAQILASVDFTDLLTDTELSTITTTDIQYWLDNCPSVSEGGNIPDGLPGHTQLVANNLPNTFQCSSTFIPTPPTPDDCDTQLTEFEQQQADAVYNQQLAALTSTFQTQYTSSCLTSIEERETFTVTYLLNEYHYTLFYYDQAGNLVKTVPPHGVNTIEDGEALKDANGAACTLVSLNDIHTYRESQTGSACGYVRPAHTMETRYHYNSLNQLVKQITPDGGESEFWYDGLGRIVVSQNAKQKAGNSSPFENGAQADAQYSYIIYDELHRTVQSGQTETPIAMTYETARQRSDLDVWLAGGTRSQVSKIFYDDQQLFSPFAAGTQEQLRNRVASTTYQEVLTSQIDDDNDYTFATHYTYDVHGNVTILKNENRRLAEIGQDIKTTEYEFDLVSGNVNEVKYQEGKFDEFYHRYCYDADNRITQVFTSSDGEIWKKDAKYFYYHHGPLARSEMGDQLVQACDYTYTLQGWLKGVNSGTLVAERDPGKDGSATIATLNSNTAQDVTGFTLGYYQGDYKAINNAGEFEVNNTTNSLFLKDKSQLYNGNIGHMVTAITNALGNVTPQAMVYEYDQLNRLKEGVSEARIDINNNQWQTFTPIQHDYRVALTYDGNGNIMTLDRDGLVAGTPTPMDQFNYNYLEDANGEPLNQLEYVSDAVASTNYTVDIDNQLANTYNYDEIGELIQDDTERIGSITWTADGKIRKVERSGMSMPDGSYPPDLEFEYDASRQRCIKIVKPYSATGTLLPQSEWVYTYYARDAQGNTLTTYKRTRQNKSGGAANEYEDVFTAQENHIYGSKRAGLFNNGASLTAEFTAATTTINGEEVFINQNYAPLPDDNDGSALDVEPLTRTLGEKNYELTNHLGNVLSTVSDRKTPVDNNTDNNADYYIAEVTSFSDYYPFGMQMPGRHGNTGEYRYGFQGQETDDEITGSESHVTWTNRCYDSRLGRWLSLDRAAAAYPSYSPYSFAGLNPITNVEVNGDWWLSRGHRRESKYVLNLTDPGKIWWLDVWGYVPGIDKVTMIPKIFAAAQDPAYSLSAGDWFTIVAPVGGTIYKYSFKYALKGATTLGALTKTELKALGVKKNVVNLVTKIANNFEYAELEIEREAMIRYADENHDKGYLKTNNHDGNWVEVEGFVYSEKYIEKIEGEVRDEFTDGYGELTLDDDEFGQEVQRRLTQGMEAMKEVVRQEYDDALKKAEQYEKEQSESNDSDSQ